jgi:O-antigen/teichoic acid export membrane protein
VTTIQVAPDHADAQAHGRAHDRYHHAIKRGALFNLLGTLARLGYPLFLLLVTRLWGSAFGGLYLLAQAMIEVASCAVIDGPADATIVFASHYAEGARDDALVRERLYRVLGTTLRVGLGLAAIVAAATLLLGGPVIRAFFPEFHELLPGLYLLGFTLLPRALSQTAVAATKALLHMQYDALLNGLLFPLLLLGGGAIVYLAGGRLTALLGLQLAADCALAALALWVLARHFSLSELAASFRRPVDREVLAFVLPQGANLTFNRYINRLDSIMLAGFGLAKSDLGFFSTAALLTSLFAQIRMMFSGALAPVAARYHGAGERGALEETMGRVARWSIALVVPAVLVFLVFRADLLGLVSPDYRQASLFVVVLLIPPFTSCAYGLAGACLMFTGHSRVTLTNSVAIAVFNTGLAYALIPRLGTLGAALATATATSTMTALQMVELARLERVAIRWRAVWKPHVALLLGLVPIVVTWDPARLSAVGKTAVAALACVIYAVTLLVLRLDEAVALARRIRPKLPS